MQKHISPRLAARVGIAALGVGILAAVGTGAAVADENIDVSVEIEPGTDPGALSLTVANNSVALAEAAPTVTDRVFTGTLPTVTVTDTRPAGTITDPAVEWYVMGSITDFSGDAGQPVIRSSDSFGWAPSVLSGAAGVGAGEVVEPGEGGFEADSHELLYETYTPGAPSQPGVWTANAELTLEAPLDVEPGRYGATLTLSLFEDDGN
ncbi:hypothetical protein [Agromyces seonyuensis]|uniref:WxL domain-containing protein n=1 Tax=Agromyces seonyuensis TaxID=2662446 RepID=A0A6I4P804_9MICO|nr:hypothetical protein [Agromyces seonyuensis]MWC00075.1 hypothetical protein [Agromyces seonyuensis]